MDRSARRIGMMVRLVRDRSVTLRRYYRVDFDLESSQVRALYFGPEESYIEDDQIRMLNLQDPIRLLDVITDRNGRTVEGQTGIHFSPKGMIEPAVIHIEDGMGNTRSILPNVLGGEIQIVNDYVRLSLQ